MSSAHAVERTIQFFATRLFVPNPLGGADTTAANQAAAWDRLEGMPYESTPDGKGRARLVSPGTDEAIRVERQADGAYHGRIHRTKHYDFPLVGYGERDHPLQLPSGRGLRHPTHFVWWNLASMPEHMGIPAPAEGLLAMEFNPFGPRASSLEDYVNDRLAGDMRMDILPLVDPDAWEELKHERFVKAVRVRVPSPRLLRHREDLTGLDVMNDLGGVETLTWEAKPARRGIFEVGEAALRKFIALASSDERVRLVFTKRDNRPLDVTARTVRTVVRVARMTEGTKSVNAAHLYTEIKHAYDELHRQIERSLGRDPANG
jgi:hypothetical protein